MAPTMTPSEIPKETKKETKEEVKQPTPPISPVENKQVLPKMREIIILTDGNSINLRKAEVAGDLELIAIFSELLGMLKGKRK